MVNKTAELPISNQLKLLDLSKSSYYYKPKGKPEREYILMRAIDEIYLKYPFYGARRIKIELKKQGLVVNRKAITSRMQKMGLVTLYPKPRTSIPNKAHKVYPYLLSGLSILTNDVWCADITYIPLKRGFGYVVAIMDWHSRAVLSWKFSISLESDFCIEALEDALAKYGQPKIFNTDQGSQFTSINFTKLLEDKEISISMDGKGRYMDNIFIERLWWSLKYEDIYLKAYDNPIEARAGIGKWFEFYNKTRPHSALFDASPLNYYEAYLVAV